MSGEWLTTVLSEILLLLVTDAFDEDRTHLVVLYRYWYAIMLSIPGVMSGLPK